jgi:hypothetical protein
MRSDKHQLLTQTCTKPNIKWLVHSWSTFGARTNHGQTRTQMTHHDPNLGETIIFPLIVYYVPLYEAHIQMAFCPGTPKVGTLTTLKPHNFKCRPSIEMKSKAKL